MRFLDLLLLIVENLGRRKARVALTAIGVVIGTAAVVVLVSLAIGLQKNATSSLGGIGDLTQIQVMPNYGDPSGGKPGMVVQASPRDASGGSAQPKQKLITDESLIELSALPGVIAVIPRDYIQGPSMLHYNKLEGGANIIGIGTKDLSLLGLTARSGTLTLEKGTVIVGAMVANNFYDPKMRTGQQAPAPPDLQDKQVKLILIKYSQDGIETRKTITVRVAGVIAESKGESDYSIYAPIEDIASDNQWFTGKRINRRRDGYNQVMVKVDKVENVIGITDQITSLGYQAYTPQSFVQGINGFFVVLQVIFGGVGAIALLVAAIGIANTMAMAILERTREIGLMKAVGATNRDVLSVFLGEAAGIGFIGGIGGVILGWGAGRVMDVLAVAYLAGQAAQQGGAPPSLAVHTPLWLPAFALVFATLVGLVSGLYPALRAATLVPVTALKYE
jgi:putative ABC transport system permease protein